MSNVKTIDLGLKNAYDELFMDNKGREENRAPKILDIPIAEIDDIPEHPFKVKIDEDTFNRASGEIPALSRLRLPSAVRSRI